LSSPRRRGEVEDAEGNVTAYEYNGFKGLAKTTYEDDTYEVPTYDDYRRVTQTRGRWGQTIHLAPDQVGGRLCAGMTFLAAMVLVVAFVGVYLVRQ
jgi:hypothetical protein